jgi:hypothetical protein
MDVEPPTPREGQPRPGGPYEGVPGHLSAPLRHWLDGVFGYTPNYASEKGVETILAVAAAARVPLRPGAHGTQLHADITSFTNQSPDNLLDVLHYAIQTGNPPVEHLDRLLVYGGSVWTATYEGLQRRVDPTAQEAFEAASSPGDVVSEELRHAWGKAYGREPDASDAWDHAIKAVEGILIPIVVPTQAGAHIGHVIGELDHHGLHWDLLLRFNQTSPPINPPTSPVQAMVGMLRLLHPNPDRHVGRDRRVPTIEEAQAVVNLAVTIVQWARNDRDGQILKK